MLISPSVDFIIHLCLQIDVVSRNLNPIGLTSETKFRWHPCNEAVRPKSKYVEKTKCVPMWYFVCFRGLLKIDHWIEPEKKKKHLCESEYTFQIFISSQSHTNSLLQSHIKGRVVGLKCGWVAESLSSMNEAVGSISALQKLKENSSLKYDYNRDRNNQIIISQNKLTSYTRTDNRDTHDD